VPLFAYITIATVFIAAPLLAEATPRYDESLCEEVAEAVLESVAFGYLSNDDADHIIDGCYNIFRP
jgi:hypothetical protein